MHKTGNIRLMARMGLFVKPLAPHMLLAVFLGVAGFLCTIYIPYFSALLIGHIAIQAVDLPIGVFFAIMLMLALLRGILHYGEQACNRYTTFKLFTILWDRIFIVLRRFAPARLERQDKRSLIYLITSNIGALEILYAHTISPMLITVVTFGILLIQFAKTHILFFTIALLGYLLCGVLLSLIIIKLGTQEGCQSQKGFGRLSGYMPESLRGMQNVLQYRIGNQHMEEMQRKNGELHDTAKRLELHERASSILGNAVVTLFTLLMLLDGCLPYLQRTVSFTMVLAGIVLMVSSFRPVLALASLSNNLLITMVSARHVLQLLGEEKGVEEVSGKKQAVSGDIKVENLSFSYEKEGVLRSMQATFKRGKITGIHGKSGSGESTLLRLIMRFWSVSQGSTSVHSVDLKDINTSDLRNMRNLVTQETVLFHDTIFDNIRIAKLDASVDGIEEAHRKAGIHEFIISLPKDYAAPVTKLGDPLPGGERRRIGLARASLHDCGYILLDEPASNLGVLNEAVILKDIQAQKDKTILLISHRPTTMHVADTVLSVESRRTS